MKTTYTSHRHFYEEASVRVWLRDSRIRMRCVVAVAVFAGVQSLRSGCQPFLGTNVTSCEAVLGPQHAAGQHPQSAIQGKE
jgi:hypothetical protein